VFKRKTSGSVLCTSCGVLVGVGDDKCYNCGRRNPGLWGWAPTLRALGADLGFGPFIVSTCIIVYALTMVFSLGSIGMSGLGLLGPSPRASFLFGESGAYPVLVYGRWWTVITACWLHGGILHIFMNMMAVRQLAPGVVELYGPGRTAIIYMAGSAVGFTLTTFAFAYVPPIVIIPGLIVLQGSVYTVGASASIAGLIGAVLAYSHRSGSTMARMYASQYIIALVFIGFLFPRVDNYAHAGGFLGGYLAARLLDPMKAERIDHIVIGVTCIVVSLVAIVVSFFHGLKFM
jgi:rhomboid protease GluP